ncbi:MAG TPA: hypothetical protein VK816_04685 [Jatrophihabitantaceae bacterium]|jgi:hypothetical protein|nr:hypothetical protein [Jatrophihabitantaceae bacterium]
MTTPYEDEQRAALLELAVAAARMPGVEPSSVTAPSGERPDPKLIDLLLAVARVSNRQGHVPRSEQCGRADGSFVELDTAEPFVRQAFQLLHWLGHAFDQEPPAANPDTEDRELVAEAVAILVGRKLVSTAAES